VKKPDHSLGGVHVYHDTIYRNEKTDNNPTFSVPKKPSVEHITGQEAHDANRSNRQNMILGLLRKKGDLTIKDISIVIKDCSEKTIQRELIAFISSGLVKRAGERRWSRYSLTQPL
jgi:predicted HTH transcriptional regulator